MILSPFLYICDLVCSLFVPGLSSTLLQTVNNHIQSYTRIYSLRRVAYGLHPKIKVGPRKEPGIESFLFCRCMYLSKHGDTHISIALSCLFFSIFLWSKDTWSLPIFVLVSTLFFQHCPASNTCCYNSWRMETPFHW